MSSDYLHIFLDIKKYTISYNGLYDAPVGNCLLDFLYYDLGQLGSQRDSDLIELHPYFRIHGVQDVSPEKIAKVQAIYRTLFEYLADTDQEKPVPQPDVENYLKRYHSIVSINVKLSEDCYLIDYMTKDFEDCLYIEMTEMLRNHCSLKYCKNCGRLFVPAKGNIEYCQRICTSEGKTCAQVGYSNTFAKTVKNDQLLHAYTKAYKAHYARMTKPRKRAANMTREAFEAWYREAKINLEKARKGEMPAEAFYEWLKI